MILINFLLVFAAIAIFPYAAAFIFCFILGVIATVFEKLKKLITFKKSSIQSARYLNNKSVTTSLKSKEQIRAEAGKIFLSQIKADEETTFH